MAQYSIDQFSRITGLNKILIRTWENRYNFLKPKRTSTNIRYYNDKMLTKGIKYAILVNDGYKISKLIKYKDQQINDLIGEKLKLSENIDTKYNIYISRFLEAALDYNQELFDKNYNECVKDIGFINFYIHIVTKTMNQISVLYLNNEIIPANEHFLSENFSQQLQHQIAITKTNITNKDPWVLFLPEDEYHDIGLLFAHLILKMNNQQIIYLGQNTPRESLLDLRKKSKNFLFFLKSKREKKFLDDLCLFLNNKIKESKIYVIDNQEFIKTKYSNIIKIKDVDEFINILKYDSSKNIIDTDETMSK